VLKKKAKSLEKERKESETQNPRIRMPKQELDADTEARKHPDREAGTEERGWAFLRRPSVEVLRTESRLSRHQERRQRIAVEEVVRRDIAFPIERRRRG
jgi:hypothetical protein